MQQWRHAKIQCWHHLVHETGPCRSDSLRYRTNFLFFHFSRLAKEQVPFPWVQYHYIPLSASEKRVWLLRHREVFRGEICSIRFCSYAVRISYSILETNCIIKSDRAQSAYLGGRTKIPQTQPRRRRKSFRVRWELLRSLYGPMTPHKLFLRAKICSLCSVSLLFLTTHQQPVRFDATWCSFDCSDLKTIHTIDVITCG